MTAGSDNKFKPFVVPLGEGQKDISADLLVRRLASAEQTGGQFSLIEFSGVRGLGPPLHTHANEHEAFFILDGRISVTSGDIEGEFVPGDFIFIPQTTPHKFTIESAYGRFLCFISPGGFEEFFTEIGVPTEHAYPPVPGQNPPSVTGEKFVEVGRKWGFARVEQRDLTAEYPKQDSHDHEHGHDHSH